MLVQEIENHASGLIQNQLDAKYTYHNLAHTQNVVRHCHLLAEEAELTELETERLLIAGWFHDTGYIQGHKDHEVRSVEYAKAFLLDKQYDAYGIEVVCKAIADTKYPQKPQSKLGEYLCDADLSGVGSEDYLQSTGNLRKEMAETCALYSPDGDWLADEIKFLSNHQYITETGRKLFEPKKQKNIEKLKQMQEDLPEVPAVSSTDVAEKKKNKKVKEPKPKAYSRGVETMFRAGARTHINLSSMADSKANIMLSINAMIISVTLTVLIPKLDTNAHLIMPTLVLLGTCLAAIVLATLSTRPVINKGLSSKQDIANKRSNLLFFGNFHSMDLEDYEDGMKQMMEDNDFLYGSLTRDMYYLGKVLNKKYRYLRLCYTIFMYGMIASVIAYGYAFWSM
ncbi:MAG: HD superfamily phosphodiesterase [Bacteroidia bacterium]|jgi:HD superfamily phosphodiesterase